MLAGRHKQFEEAVACSVFACDVEPESSESVPPVRPVYGGRRLAEQPVPAATIAGEAESSALMLLLLVVLFFLVYWGARPVHNGCVDNATKSNGNWLELSLWKDRTDFVGITPAHLGSEDRETASPDSQA